MGKKLSFSIEYPSSIGLVYNALYHKVIDIINPTYIDSPHEINHGDCFGFELGQIIVNLNQLKMEHKGFDFSVWLDSWPHESGLTGFDFNYFYKDGWHTKEFYNAVEGSGLFKFLSHNGFVMTNENGDFFRFAGSQDQARVISEYIGQEVKPYLENIANTLKVDASHIPYEMQVIKNSETLYAIWFDFSQLEDVD
jgi:hypothetical protein